jgi:phosphocarrier protein HPr
MPREPAPGNAEHAGRVAGAGRLARSLLHDPGRSPSHPVGFLGCKAGGGRSKFRPLVSPFMDQAEATSNTQQHVREFIVLNKMGIHARPAAMVVRITNRYKCDVFVEKDEEQVNGKSIMGLMMLAAGKGSTVRFIATGEDAPQMLAELEQLFARKFEEA